MLAVVAARFDFAQALLDWFDKAGRKHLPWQQDITPYRVWVSEIMLQQTQVNTVIPYFQRFMSSFPDVQALAAASQNDVLAHWTGLGYYSRARNLHRTAQIIAHAHDNEFPHTVAALEKLPGIGRSTAAAIVSIAHGKPAAILDGNVKRVLARFHAVSGWPGDVAVARSLWTFAEAHSPAQRPGDYTQAIMDLGATVCTRSRPDCNACPLATTCIAFQENSTADFPGRRPRKTLPTRQVQMLMLCNPAGEVLLEQRPAPGLWGGLWCFPELSLDQDPSSACDALSGQIPAHIETWPGWRHTFSHFHLDITPVAILLGDSATAVAEDRQRWVLPRQPGQIGLAAPVKHLLAKLATVMKQVEC